MSVLDLVIAPDPILSTCADPVKNVNDEIIRLAQDMIDTMNNAQGIGLAAVQVGVSKRVIVVHIPKSTQWDYEEEFPQKDGYASTGDVYCMINPKIISSSKELITLQEGCLSIPGTRDKVTRSESVIVEYTDRNNEVNTLKAERWLARCIQHEIDHLNGVLFINHLSKMKCDMALKKSAKAKKLSSKI